MFIVREVNPKELGFEQRMVLGDILCNQYLFVIQKDKNEPLPIPSNPSFNWWMFDIIVPQKSRFFGIEGKYIPINYMTASIITNHTDLIHKFPSSMFQEIAELSIRSRL